MKKLVLFAAAALVASASVFAQEQPVETNPFKFSGAAYAYGAMFNTVKKDNSASYGSYRFRPYFTYATANTEATVKLEIDQILGGGNAGQADVGNDEKAMIEVKAAYLKFGIPAVEGLSVKGGVDEYKTVGGFTCGTEIGLGLVNYNAGMIDLNLLMAKIWEPNYLDVKSDDATEKNDVTFYGVDATVKLSDEIKIRPALYAINGEKNQDASSSKVAFVGKTAFIPSLGASAKFGNLSVDFAAAYGNCAKDENDMKYSGYALDLAPSFKVSDDIKVGAFFTMLSGDDNTGDDKSKSFKAFMLKSDGWGRMYLLEDSMTFANAGAHDVADVRGNTGGYILAGGFLSYKMSSIEMKLQGAYGRLHKAASGSKKDLGLEIDGQVSYEVAKNAKIIAEGAILATGKAFGEDGSIYSSDEKQKSTYLALGMSYKW